MAGTTDEGVAVSTTETDPFVSACDFGESQTPAEIAAATRLEADARVRHRAELKKSLHNSIISSRRGRGRVVVDEETAKMVDSIGKGQSTAAKASMRQALARMNTPGGFANMLGGMTTKEAMKKAFQRARTDKDVNKMMKRMGTDADAVNAEISSRKRRDRHVQGEEDGAGLVDADAGSSSDSDVDFAELSDDS